MSTRLLRKLIKEENKNLSLNLITRLMGFLDEIDTVRGELMNAYGVGTVWKDRAGADDKHIVKSQVEQLIHLSSELSSLGNYLNKQFNDKNLNTAINQLVGTLGELSKATKSSGLGKLFSKHEDVVEAVRAKNDEVQTRVRAVKKYVEQLKARAA